MGHEKQSHGSAQPHAIAPMVIPGPGNRNVQRLPYDKHGQRDWSFSLCGGCGEGKLCCLACWCPGVIHAQNRRRVEYLNVHGIPEPERKRLFGTDSILYALLECCGHMGWILQVPTRKAVRERYNIHGGCMSDCCTSYLCHSCALVQENRELEQEEETMLGPMRA